MLQRTTCCTTFAFHISLPPWEYRLSPPSLSVRVLRVNEFEGGRRVGGVMGAPTACNAVVPPRWQRYDL
jgi:hypothetical protein